MAGDVDGNLLPGESIIIEGKKVSFQLKSSYPTAPLQTHTEGSVVLTTAKLLLFWSPDEQLSIPYHCIRHVQIQQPIFGANYIEVTLVAPEQAEWEGPARIKIYFSTGGCIDFTRALVRLSQEGATRPGQGQHSTAEGATRPGQGQHSTADSSQDSLDDKKNK